MEYYLFLSAQGRRKKLLRHWGRREARKFGNRWYRVWSRAVDGNELLSSFTYQYVI